MPFQQMNHLTSLSAPHVRPTKGTHPLHCSNLKALEQKVQKGQYNDAEEEDDDVMILEDIPNTPDAEKEIAVKVRLRSQLHKFPMKKVKHGASSAAEKPTHTDTHTDMDHVLTET